MGKRQTTTRMVAIMTEELFWQRVSYLWKMIQSIEDDLMYKVIWEDKLKELMKKYEF